MEEKRPSALDARHVSLLWASPDRAPAIAAMHVELFNPPWDEASILKLLEHPAAAALVATAGPTRETAGFVIAQLAGDEAEILSLGVAMKWQRLGLGRRLIEGLIRAAQRAEARRLFLEVSVDNEAALKLYESLDFRRVGVRPKYYTRKDHAPVDALILALDF
jgi:[ribosomal protein S18]-alanine N-acetyltransferase